jgi:dihydrofolate reductase
MRKLKLQMHMTMDGFVGRTNGDTDWMWLPGERDENGFLDVVKLAESCDTLLLGRKMTRIFIDHWENMADTQPDNPAWHLAQLIVDMRKIAFSKTATTIAGRNLEVENGDLAAVVRELKSQPGKDILVYGGADFVSSLISLNLIDEYTLIVNPVAIGQGMSIFKEQKQLKLLSSHAYKSGKIITKYIPV